MQAIINSIEYKESIKADFSTSLSEGLFHSVLELLKQSPNVSVSEPEDKGNNGIIYRVTTNFGDYATLTYFKTTTKMRYQGLMMKLYSVVKSYLITSSSDICVNMNTIKKDYNEELLDREVQKKLEMYFPIGWVNLEPTVQGFVKDSFILAESSTKLSDYAAYVMPIIRVLEYRIKKICLDCNIMINDKSGFKYFPDVENPKDGKWIFTMSCGKITGVNPEISVMSSSAKQSIIECYDFLLKNRHEMFHANQILMGTKLVETKEEAIQMIIEASELIEKSLTYKTVQTN